jgi:uncharacterized protein YgbK (DUF1537 family)
VIRLTIIADDLTGACDAGALFCGRGRVTVLTDHTGPRPEMNGQTLALHTGSRSVPPDEAARRVRDACARIGPRLSASHVLKKIDSTLRGPIAAELDALLAVTGLTGALVTPAFPAQGRTVRGGVLHVAGVPAHETPVGRDPDYPGATSDVVEILTACSTRPVRRLTLDDVRGPRADLDRALELAEGAVLVADAETDADLLTLAQAARSRPSLLLAGSAGLAGALATAIGAPAPSAAVPREGTWLIVAGSLHPATRAQVGALEGAGVAGVWVDPVSPVDPAPAIAALATGQPAFVASRPSDHRLSRLDGVVMARRLAGVTHDVLGHTPPAVICLTGGDTAQAVLHQLGARCLELTGAPAAGLAIGDASVTRGTTRATLAVLTKAGGFGAPDLFLTLARGTRPRGIHP